MGSERSTSGLRLDKIGLVERTLYSYDANYNVTALWQEGANGWRPVERYSYDPYGQVTVLHGGEGYDPEVDGVNIFEWQPKSANPDGSACVSRYDNEILYCGYRFDWETGLYNVRHRIYHPTLGRWTKRDPAGYVDGMSLFGAYFVPNSMDPSGLKCVYTGNFNLLKTKREKSKPKNGLDISGWVGFVSFFFDRVYYMLEKYQCQCELRCCKNAIGIVRRPGHFPTLMAYAIYSTEWKDHNDSWEVYETYKDLLTADAALAKMTGSLVKAIRDTTSPDDVLNGSMAEVATALVEEQQRAVRKPEDEFNAEKTEKIKTMKNDCQTTCAELKGTKK